MNYALARALHVPTRRMHLVDRLALAASIVVVVSVIGLAIWGPR